MLLHKVIETLLLLLFLLTLQSQLKMDFEITKLTKIVYGVVGCWSSQI